MLDIGWSEMAIVAVIALIVIGPKELPRTMRTVAHWFSKARSLAREFQSGLDDIVREADLDDARKALNATRDFSPNKMIADTVDPTGGVASEMKDVETAAKADPGSDGHSEQGAAQTVKENPKSDDAPKAAMVKQPASVAPAHSVTPPPQPAVVPDASSVGTDTSGEGGDTSKQSA